MNHFVILGKIVRAATQEEAVLLFTRRKEMGISGVVFTPDLNIPDWSEADKANLTRTLNFLEVENERDKALANQLLSLADKFNICTEERNIYFRKDYLVHEPPHNNPDAVDGWMYVHFDGHGMSYASPLGLDPIQISSMNKGREGINLSEFNKLVRQKKIELIETKVGDVIIFDESMILAPCTKQGFSGVFFGKN